MSDSPEPAPYDAVMVVSFGGPEKSEDVMPFLEHVVRGRPVPKARLEEVAQHYYHFDGVSPINRRNREFVEALADQLQSDGPKLPVFFANLHWHPFLQETIAKMQFCGVGRALAYVTSAFGGASGCRKYLDAIETARHEVGADAPIIDKIRLFYNHPGFIEAMAARVQDALARLPGARIIFTAHSVPTTMAGVTEYAAQLEEACRLVAEHLEHAEWQLVFQSRSGPPSQPWLEPDVRDHLRALGEIGSKKAVIAPIGFLVDHMEVLWDLDVEAKRVADEVGIELVRAETVGTHPIFVKAIAELIAERTGDLEKRRALGRHGPALDICSPDCCRTSTLDT